MGKATTADIVKWAEDKAKPADSPAYSRVTAEQLQIMRALRKAGRTQTYIAKEVGVSQSTVSFWLNELTDTTDIATEYLRGKALHMAKNVVENGQARDHIQALKGIGALEVDNSSLAFQINLSLPGLPTVSASATPVINVSPVDASDNA